MWKDYELTVNSLPQKVRFNDTTVKNLFLPLIDTLQRLHNQSKQRIIAFVAAPPATGKSTLTLFLEQLANKQSIPLQAIGLDGFHYPNEYLNSHTIERDGNEIPLIKVKGCPESFDAEHLADKLNELRANNVVKWPVYSRKLHDPVEDAQTVDKDIIILEGNWLLLKDERWTTLRKFADYALFITADADVLKNRLISRKIQGGSTEEQATAFYEASDKANVERTLNDSVNADEVWLMDNDGDFCLKK